MYPLKFIVIFGVLASVSCAHFEFGDKPGRTCILMDIDARFNLTYAENKNETEIAPEFGLEGAEVVNGSSICGDEKFDSVLTVQIFPTREHVTFRIGNRDTTDHLSMSLTLSVHPGSHFSDLNDSLPFELKDNKNLPVGVYSNDSYLCRSEQRMIFDNIPPYNMTVKIMDLHVQAFLVKNAEYGPVNECPLDPSPFPYTTSSEVTTTEPENITTEPPETTMTTQPHSEITMTTQPHSEITLTTQPHSETTMTTKPPITTEPETLDKYVLRNGKVVCAVMKGKITFEIPYVKTGGKSGTAMVDVPKYTTVSGSCSVNGTNTEQEMMIMFNNGWDFTIMITKDGKSSARLMSDNDDDFSWQKVSLTYVIDNNFPDALHPGQKFTAIQTDNLGEFKAGMAGSYKCVAKQQITLQKNVKVDLSDFQYRAFGTSAMDDFSAKDVSECAADDKGDDGSDKTLAIILGAGFGGLAVLILLAGLIFRCRRQRQRRGYEYETFG